MKMSINEKEVSIQSPKDAIENKMAFVTEDRKKDGLVLNQSMIFNYTLPQLEPTGLLEDAKALNAFESFRNQLHIKSVSAHQQCDTLSGGNQQKVIMAKWLGTNPHILLMDEPTRGIDISAKDEMYELMKEMAKDGLAILFASSEIPEIISLSDRVVVMSNGKITKELIGESINEKDLLYAALPSQRA
jgi:ABC-type sugar transport system ATPase subunit